MDELEKVIRQSIASLDVGWEIPNAKLTEDEKLLYSVASICRIFEKFLRIHPYANGNGHAARFIVWAVLGRFGYWPIRCPVEPKPDPPYTELIVTYRNGDTEPLEKFILSCLAP